MTIEALIKELRKGLEGVTPGTWDNSGGTIGTYVEGRHSWTLVCFAGTNYAFSSEAVRNSAHIARCNPANISALLAHIAALQERVEKAEAEIAELTEYVNEDKADANKWRALASVDGPANSFELWKDRAEAAELRLKIYEEEDARINAEFVAIADAALKEAEEVIRPFADLSAHFNGKAGLRPKNDGDIIASWATHTVNNGEDTPLTVGHLRAARRWIAARHTEGGEDGNN
jgi:hypothetical protein